MTDLERQLQGYRLTTAEIIYRCPDHLSVLQTFIWQEFDLAPRYPELRKFLEFWSTNLDGPLHSVKVMSGELIKSVNMPYADSLHVLH